VKEATALSAREKEGAAWERQEARVAAAGMAWAVQLISMASNCS
jgi:hypothetical protein